MNDVVAVRSKNGYAGIYARQEILQGERLLPVRGHLQPYPTRYSIQVAPGEHVAPPMRGQQPARGEANAWCFMNHSCEPNLHFDVEARTFVALRDIGQEEELTFNYNTTEWDMESPFACRCGAATCYGWVRGFKHLSAGQQQALLSLAAPHIRHLHEENGRP